MTDTTADPAVEPFDVVDVIRTKRDGGRLEDGQIDWVIDAYTRGVVAEDRLDDTFVDALCEPAEVFTYGGMIAHVLTFAAHRRTLVALAFGRHGVDDLGWGDPMLWVAAS